MVLHGSAESAEPHAHVTPFRVRGEYTRNQVADLISLPQSHRKGGSWNTGYMRWQDAFFIFCNIDTPGRTGHDYANHWNGNLLNWSGKTASNLRQPLIQAMISGRYPVHLFWRRDDRAPFRYAGLASPYDIQDTTPVRITWAFDSAVDHDSALEQHPTPPSPAAVVREPPPPVFRHGPVPFIGERTFKVTDAETCVYVMRLAGPLGAVFPDLAPNHAVIKVGRSNNVSRRCRELNNGFPYGCLLSWVVEETHIYPTVNEADTAERNLHILLEKHGYWISGEFFAVPETLLPLLG